MSLMQIESEEQWWRTYDRNEAAIKKLVSRYAPQFKPEQFDNDRKNEDAWSIFNVLSIVKREYTDHDPLAPQRDGFNEFEALVESYIPAFYGGD